MVGMLISRRLVLGDNSPYLQIILLVPSSQRIILETQVASKSIGAVCVGELATCFSVNSDYLHTGNQQLM